MNAHAEHLLNYAEVRLASRATREQAVFDRLLRLQERLRAQLPPSVPKRAAAEALRISVPGLDKWLDRGALAVVQTSKSRQQVETRPLLVLVEEVLCQRENEGSRFPVRDAIAKLRLPLYTERRVLRPEIAKLPRVNPSEWELRDDYLNSTPAERLALASSLSRTATQLAAAGARARRKQHAGA